ncbi:NADH-quinone oxidoreductase subunit 15 [Deinococcus misasensis]|uniref:NADH-quinone oxidoreductase subunit 15 n=1 Tax=Deinococcus misasensis TaxID=392413 RepID=UPI000554467D|nr:NADH-quinone oxidoreductase subunit 15 [Deinococcus misasensis]
MQDTQKIYVLWTNVLGWMQELSQELGLTFVKVSDFPDYIYRMERGYDLPTIIASASVQNARGETLLLAAVSPRHVEDKGISLRLHGGSKHWHLHEHHGELLEGKRPFTRERLKELLEKARDSTKSAV